MADRSIIRGQTIDEKFASIDQILCKFQKRLATRVIGVMPPVVLLGNVAQASRDGSIWMANCPVQGQLVTATILVGAAEKEECEVTLYITKDLMATKQTIPLKVARNEIVKLRVEVVPGTLIALTSDPAYLMQDVYIGIAIEVSMNAMSTKDFPIDPFLAAVTLEEVANASKSP